MAGKIDWISFALPVERKAGLTLIAERLTSDWPLCRLGDSSGDAAQRAAEAGAPFCVVVNDAGVVLGLVDAGGKSGGTEPVEETLQPGPTTLRPSYSVEDAAQVLESKKMDAIIVTSSDGKFLGVFERSVPRKQAARSPGAESES